MSAIQAPPDIDDIKRSEFRAEDTVADPDALAEMEIEGCG
jgi:hypothetical protein